MTAMRTVKRLVFCVGVYVAFAVAMSASVASAETLAPWWGLTSQARPTDLREVEGKNEVLELTISATGGKVALINTERFSFATREGLAIVPYDATAEQVEEALASMYPANKMTVTGGPGDEEGTKPYVITIPDQSVTAPVAIGGFFETFFGGEPLSCEGATGPNCRETAEITEVAEGKSGANVTVVAENLGDASTDSATPVSIADKLPPGLEAVAIEGFAGNGGTLNRGPVECTLKTLKCTFSGALSPYELIEVHVSVVVGASASSGERNVATISGGGAAAGKTATQVLDIGGGKRFGIEDYELTPEDSGGVLDTQAGSHPFQLTSVVVINQEAGPTGLQPVALPKGIVSELPVGLVGNPTPFTQCTDAQFQQRVKVGSFGGLANGCPAQATVGVANVTYRLGNSSGSLVESSAIPIFNMTPLHGEPARFGFQVKDVASVFLDTSIRTGSDYGVTVSSSAINQEVNLVGVRLTFWGVPGDPRHDSDRGNECIEGGTCAPSTNATPPPFLIMPTSCAQPYESTLRAESWGAGTIPSYQATPVVYRLPEALDGCNHLPFGASIGVAPDATSASTASGLTVDVHVPQEAELNPAGLAESTLRDTTVTLPAGVGLNPAGADGLQSCSESQIGFLPGESSGDELRFTPTTSSCPDASKIGTVKIKTPLLPNPLEGAVYLAAQEANPFGSLIAMYIVVEDPVSGVLVKLAGKVVPDPVTGQLVSTFKNTPQLPFEDLELHFFGGDRAPLGTPALCGSYAASALFAPWSGEAAVNTSSMFAIGSGPNAGPCLNPLPFAPELTAGSTNLQAGAFSPFTMTMSRQDGNQNLKAVQLKMPPGLLGTLTGVKLCPEAQANAGTCGPESLIGETVVSVGLGSNPYSVRGGKVYITQGYEGAPYGLSIVNPAKAGPFDLGTVVVRAKIQVDALTAALTVTTDGSGPHAIPHILDGIPLQIKHINVTITRGNGFTFNPTNCEPMKITGSLTSSQGSESGLAVPFQVTNCATLAFKPQFKVSTRGKTSRKTGASLDVKLSYPKAAWGSQANIRYVKVDLPKQLPSYLPTLQKACLESTFAQNPADCPVGSIVGTATASTPVIPVPLTGPAYFVSNGGAKWPELVIVLSGYGVTVQLHGETFISKGVTSSTFSSVPDVPIGSFELKLPQGPSHALAANGNLCTSKLRMPTKFVAQNGMEIRRSTPITATGCSKHKPKHRKHKKRKRRKHKKRKHRKGKAK